MCQLLGMNCNKPASISFSFEGFCRRGGQTDEHSDGWGIAFFEDQGCRLVIDDKPSVTSPLDELVKRNPVKCCNVVAHIRKATQGPVALENSHPFKRELWGRSWVFAHNGHLKLFTPAERKAGLYVEHNVNALLRGDIVSRFAAYHSALADGWMNRDEIRQRENLNPIGEETGGDKFLVQLNQTTLEKIGEDETLETPAEAATEEATGEEVEPGESTNGDASTLESVNGKAKE